MQREHAARERPPDRQDPREPSSICRHGAQRHPDDGRRPLVFTNESGRLVELDAVTGHLLWNVDAGGNLSGAPMTYEGDGGQYVLTRRRVALRVALPEAGARK